MLDIQERAGAEAGIIRRQVVDDMINTAVREFPDRPAMSFLGRRWTYRELGGLIDRVAAGLQEFGVEKGTRVGLCLPNTPYSVIFYFAVMRAGGIVCNFNPLYTTREIANQIRDSGTSIMVVTDLEKAYRSAADAAAEAGVSKIVVCPFTAALPGAKSLLFRLAKGKEIAKIPNDSRHVPYRRLLAGRPVPRPVATLPEDVAVLQYTGGTTGVPKGAMLSHANITANAQQIRIHAASLKPGEERMLVVLPLFHVFAMSACMNLAVLLGAEMILLPRFDLFQTLQVIEKQKATLFPAVPTIYGAINAASEKKKYDLASLKVCISGGAPLPHDIRVRFEELTGCWLVEGYGLTEASPVVSCNPIDGREVKDGSVGIWLTETQVEIRDPENRHELKPQGEKGEIWVRGPQVMLGYWNRPADTADVMVDGALRTGDIGYLDKDGYLYLVDRIKDLILCSGYNVYPRVIEEALYLFPAIVEAIVIGVPDEYRGQAPKAFVKLREGTSATEEEILEFLKDQISKIEMPKTVVFRDSLPKTMIGKLSKKELVEEERLAREAAAAGRGTKPS